MAAGTISFIGAACAILVMSVEVRAEPTNATTARNAVSLTNAAPESAMCEVIETQESRARIRSNGTLESLEFRKGGAVECVKFRSDTLSGPAWADVPLRRQSGAAPVFTGLGHGVWHTLAYELSGNRLLVCAGLKNQGPSDYQPKAARLIIGIDCAMVRYPDWNEAYFPTLMRCEPTHFWGYFMTPRGKILTIGCSEPVASYHLNYQANIWGQGDGGHIIHTVSLDVLHALPLPSRHPQNLTSLKPGEERNWTIVLEPAATLEAIKPLLASRLGAPMIEADRYTLAGGEAAQVKVWSATPITASIVESNGTRSPVSFRADGAAEWVADILPSEWPGLYALNVADGNGHKSEGMLSVRQPWSWYMNQARKESLHHRQYASSHLEQWLGLTTGALARRHLPDAELDKQTDQRLREILGCQWDLDKMCVKNIPHKYRHFANTAQMAGLLAYRYLADRDPYWISLASGFANYCIQRQRPNGNLSDYTSVFYPAKSILLVAQIERTVSDERYQAASLRHYECVRRAMDYLVEVKDNQNTEGQKTFEDGMISCSANQLGIFALLQADPARRQKYADAARLYLDMHRCLEQLLIPDSRMNGATLRFWEAQYDTLIGNAMNMMDSPHGWSAWLIPGLWYQYLLTGEEQWLRKAMNAMGACAQLIDSRTGELRWGFVPDPYREVTLLKPDPSRPRGKRVNSIIGETYVPMIAAFHYPDKEPVSGNSDKDGWTCCNDVHEVFIAMEEVALTSAYVIERADGSWSTYNCKAAVDPNGVLTLQPAEPVVKRVHLNLRNPRRVQVRFDGSRGSHEVAATVGMQWIGSGGVPEILRVFR